MRAHSHYFGSALSGVWIGENLVVEISLSFIYFFLCKFRCVCFYLSLRALYRRNEVQAIVEYWRLLVFTAMALEDLKLSCASVRHVTIETLKIQRLAFQLWHCQKCQLNFDTRCWRGRLKNISLTSSILGAKEEDNFLKLSFGVMQSSSGMKWSFPQN